MSQTLTRSIPTVQLAEAGQSPWLDFISRDWLVSGQLKKMIQMDGVLGVTSNPSIFQQAISSGKSYAKDIQKLSKQGYSALEIYDRLSIVDIQKACDLFLSIYKKTQGEHGYVSLEVLPGLAHFTQETIDEAQRLFAAVKRPNVMIKIPATPEGIPAIEEMIFRGVNINVTLIFSVSQYQKVAAAYISGIKRRLAAGKDVKRVRSVASVFVSRFDTTIDAMLAKKSEFSHSSAAEFKKLLGKAAVANSKLVYQEFKKLFLGKEFSSLQSKGAKIQKTLWGSTSCKNPKYDDLLYVEPLVGPETVNTMPLVTLEAVLDHGTIKKNTVLEGLSEAQEVVKALGRHGISLEEVGASLQSNGVKAFQQSFDDLMRALELSIMESSKSVKLKEVKYQFSFPPALKNAVDAEFEKLKKEKVFERLFKKDPTIWKSEPEHQKVILNRLGWLDSASWCLGKLHEIESLDDRVTQLGLKHIVLLGMGGSSLAPEVMSLICRKGKAGRSFQILDSTDPAQIRKLESSIQLNKTLFIVASKSGSTIETSSQYKYFFHAVKKLYKKNPALTGQHFIAITDEGSDLQKIAKMNKFLGLLINPTDIGGRYSALSLFGLVPAVLMKLPVREWLFQTVQWNNKIKQSATSTAPDDVFYLGAALGVFAKQFREKMTLVISPKLASFGSWLEQLIAESTGKEKLGVLPVDGEPSAQAYSEDRHFVIFKLESEKWPDASALKTIKGTQAPVFQVIWKDDTLIAQQFLAWEIVTSIAGVVLGINPFDEPNVKESKDITGKYLKHLESHGGFEYPTRYYHVDRSVELALILKQVKRSSYLSLLAFIERSEQTAKKIQEIRKQLLDAFRSPILSGFGPRYLHSIGQYYKGGVPNGLFIQFVSQPQSDIPVPETSYTFGQLKIAQALGDFEAIQNKGLPIILIDLGKNPEQGLLKFSKILKNYLSNQKIALKV